ncbi:MAG TPA: dihydrodipicolinate reductase C-terminal domain-containing protein [Terriglobales bacterium]|jgi:4-hydroxy-tetrahydrodipicolinate reductase|nr:dihydrodipicolinate reductase C-terminal domain-containing protein [Terriglobales bacterium]
MSQGLAIVGYGKMGKLIEHLAPEYGFEVRAKFSGGDNPGGTGLSHETLRGVDVAVEFTTPVAASVNIRRLAVVGVNCVVGTTGWIEQLPDAREAVEHAKTGLVWAANFSVGVNVFLQIVAQATALFAKHPEYEAWGWEIHHSAKKDAPSGTLKKLADEMRAAGYSRPISLSSNRAGAIPGTHEIGFDSVADTITFRHTAHSREGFARGALQAARWVAGKKGFYEFKEILGELT